MATERPKKQATVSGAPAVTGLRRPDVRQAAATISGLSYFPAKWGFTGRQIILADVDDLAFIIDLQKRFSNALGFIPKAGLEWYLEHRRVHLALENGQPAGYCLGRACLRWEPRIRPITQAAISFDLQRRKAGFALVRRTEDEARQQNREALQAMCRADLDANEFWQAAGFEEIGRYTPETKRHKEMICWRKQLSIHRPHYFNTMPPVCGHKARRRAQDETTTLYDR